MTCKHFYNTEAKHHVTYGPLKLAVAKIYVDILVATVTVNTVLEGNMCWCFFWKLVDVTQQTLSMVNNEWKSGQHRLLPD